MFYYVLCQVKDIIKKILDKKEVIKNVSKE